MPDPAPENGRVAFYAPMKSPDHPVPSGDRTVARHWLAALGAAGARPFVASRLRSREGTADPRAQCEILASVRREAAMVADRLSADPPAAWFTYHNYYKAPDLIGPVVAERLAIPYLLAEASSARKRAEGPYALFSAAADEATRAADAHIVLNGRDADGLRRAGASRLVRFAPFLDLAAWPERERFAVRSGPVRLAAAAMMRPGDKLASFRILAEALGDVPGDWTLAIAGDGAERARVETLFQSFGARVRFVGEQAAADLAALFRDSDLLVWPGLNEAFGMVFLEAAASGCPALAMRSGGVAEVVSDAVGGLLVAEGDMRSYAAALRGLLGDRERLLALGCGAARNARARHGLDGAADELRLLLETFGVKLESRPCA